MKFAGRLCKLTLATAAFIYALFLYDGDPLLDYTATDQSVILSVAGRSLEINTDTADLLKETYTKAESAAEKRLPSSIKNAVRTLYTFFTP